MHVNGERYTHLPDSQLYAVKRAQLCAGIQHPDLSPVQKVSPGLVEYSESNLIRQTEACRMHLETALSVIGLIFKFTTDGSVYLGLVVHIVILLSLNND